MSEQQQNKVGANSGHHELISSSSRKYQPLFLYAIGLLSTSIYLIHQTLTASTYIPIVFGLAFLIISSLLMTFNIQITITRTRLVFSIILHVSILLGWFYFIQADWKVFVCTFVWYLCAWCLSVFNREVKGKTQ